MSASCVMKELKMKNCEIPRHTVIQYVRNKKRIPHGVLVAVKFDDGNGFRIGYSLCNKKDKFNKRTALNIAMGRAANDRRCSGYAFLCVTAQEDHPRDIMKMYPLFVKRCLKYYKVNQ